MPPDSVESDAPDLPFPGAHSQVPGARRSLSGDSASDTRPARALPLGAVRERSDRGWVVRLRVRAEHIAISKAAVISERVVLRRAMVGDVVRLEAVVPAEQLDSRRTGVSTLPGRPTRRTAPGDEGQHQPEHLAARQGLPWRQDTT